MRFGAFEQRLERGIVETAQDEHLRPRKQCAVQFEGRILSRRADQNDGSILDDRQKGVLLTAIEAVNFIDEEQGALPHAAALARSVECLLQVRHAGKNRRQLLEMELEGRGEQPGNGGFARAWRTPQYDRVRPPLGDHPPDGSIFADDMILSDNLLEGSRAQPVSQWPGRVVGKSAGFEQVTHVREISWSLAC